MRISFQRVPTSTDAALRLRRLERIIAVAPPPRAAGDDMIELWLAEFPAERLAGVTEELRRRTGAEVDEIDALAMRLLLNDYTAAVARLRAVIRATEQRLSAAAPEIKGAMRVLGRIAEEHHEWTARYGASVAPR